MQPTTTNTIMTPTTIPTTELLPDPEDAVEIKTRKLRFLKMHGFLLSSLDQLSVMCCCREYSKYPMEDFDLSPSATLENTVKVYTFLSYFGF